MRSTKALRAIDATSTVSNETPNSATMQDGWLELFDGVRICPDKAVEWQLDDHPGFVPSFISCLRYGPIYNCHERLKVVGKRCETRCGGLEEGKVLVILAEQDSVILVNDTVQDIAASLGISNAQFVIRRGGHDLPIVDPKGCMDAMMGFWGIA